MKTSKFAFEINWTLEAMAEILKNCWFFWEIWRRQKDILKLTDLSLDGELSTISMGLTIGSGVYYYL